MFGILAALTSIPTRRAGRDFFNYENYFRAGQNLPRTKIYRESSEEKRRRRELVVQRSRQRIEQQIQLVRLMKKLLQQAEQKLIAGEIDEELEEMRNKLEQIQIKVERAAREKNLQCAERFDLNNSDTPEDLELERIIRDATMKIPDNEETSSIDETKNKISSVYDQGDHCLIDRLRKQTLIQ